MYFSTVLRKLKGCLDLKSDLACTQQTGFCLTFHCDFVVVGATRGWRCFSCVDFAHPVTVYYSWPFCIF